jgi:hypothetical protein
MAKGKKAADTEIDALFDLAPEAFTSARDELAKRAASEGRTDQAKAIKALRRPTVAAWAVNQLVRRRPEEVEELLETGAALRRAQRKVLSGVGGGDFRDASDRRRRIVTRLVREAEAILRELGRTSAGAGEAVRSTLEAASLEEESGEQVRSGRLSKELPPPASFGAVEGLGLVPAPREQAAPPKAKPKTKAEKEKDQAAALRAQQEQAASDAKHLGDLAAQSRRNAIRAREAAKRADQRAERLRADAEEARVKARELGKKAQLAETEAARAQEAADRASARSERLTREAPKR